MNTGIRVNIYTLREKMRSKEEKVRGKERGGTRIGGEQE